MLETTSLKALASNALARLERNKPRNKIEIKDFKGISAPILCETQNIALSKPFLPGRAFLSETYDERIAIAEYDGRQNHMQAQRIA